MPLLHNRFPRPRPSDPKPMHPRLKKLIGTVGLLLWIVLYALLVMRLAVDILPGANGLVTLLFYALAGTVWIFPVGFALPWMHRERRPK